MIKLLFLRNKLRIVILSLLVLIVPSLNFFASPPNLPHPEHPKPQFYRPTWINLNGEWNFEFDFGKSGVEKGWMKDPSSFSRKIRVPFPPESELSGIQYTDFMPSVWYHRTIEVPEDWNGNRIFLHFGAVDYDCRAWINGKLAGRHHGGSSSFSFEITDTLKEGKNDLVVCAVDELRSRIQPAGKQSEELKSHGVMYTRTTGIWQTVWLEARPKSYIQSVHIVPDLDNSRFILTPVIKDCRRGMKFRAVLFSEEGEKITSESLSASTGGSVFLELDNPHHWSPSHPYLYGLRFELLSELKVIDSVKSYAGLRKFHIEGHKFYLNNEPIFLRFVLDQGFYPDGIWSAPSDEALKQDIQLSLAVGFNGARLHQKVFTERFHYWADKLGYLTWGEFADWGLDLGDSQAVRNHNREWREVVMRDRNHPHISGFCYTELYDIEQELNGVYTYDRKLKFNVERLREIFGAPAAIEERQD